MAPSRPIPATAFGFVLDDQFLRRWAQDVLDKRHEPEKFTSLAKKESLLNSAMIVMTSVIPAHVYHAVPGLPCLHHHLLPVKEAGLLIPRLYVFVLQEDARTLPQTPENIELVRKALGLGEDQKPAWVPIDRENC